jgi:peptidoglycan/LPS O-acetylase OafA/YrhL
MPKTQINSLTSLRFFASAAIVAFHMWPLLPGDRIGVLSQGVSFFFVLSGFILTHVYGSEFDVRKFYVNRLARLWPIHVFCFALCVLLISPNPFFAPWRGIALANIFMVQSWFPFVGFPFSFNGASWSISAEIAFYLTFPLLVSTRYFWIAYGLIVATTATILMLVQPPPTHYAMFDLFPPHVVLQFPLTRLFEFATGIAAARFCTNIRPRINGTALELFAVLLVVFSAATSLAVAQYFPWSYAAWYRESGGAPIFAVAIVIFSWERGYISRALNNPVFVRLGEISFSTYMLHQIVIYSCERYFPGAPSIYAVPGILFTTYAGSYLMWRYIEVPARGFIIGLWTPRSALTFRSGRGSPVHRGST